MGPGPKWALGPNGPWAQTAPGPKRALGPMGPGPKRALGPNEPRAQMGRAKGAGPKGKAKSLQAWPKVYRVFLLHSR